MRITTLTARTAQAVAGVAAATLLAGSTGGVILRTQGTGSERPASVTAVAEKRTPATADETTTPVAVEGTPAATEATGTTTEELEAPEKDHPENFGAVVSADARDGVVVGQEIAAAARARNDERKAARAQPATPDEDHIDDPAEPDDATHGSSEQ